MKRWISWILALALLIGVPASAQEGSQPELPDLEGFALQAQNEHLSLYVREKDMLLRVVDNKTGRFLDSAQPEGQQGNASIKNLQKSMMNVSFVVNRKSGTTSAMDSWSLGVKMDSATLEKIDGGVKFRFEIGETKLTIDDLPKMIPVEKYNQLLLPHFSAKDEKDFRGQYFLMGEGQWVRSKDSGVGALIVRNMHKLLFEKAQYTMEDMVEDNTVYGYERKVFNPHVGLDVRFTLDGPDLIVTIPLDSLSITPENDLQMIDLLPYFLSAGPEDTGYILVPDGPGGIIPLNSGNISALSYLDRVYGADVLKNQGRYQSARQNIMLPVFGLRKDALAALAIIEQGAEMAELFADISGRADEFNRISPRFIIRDIEAVSLTNNPSITVPRYAEDVYEGDLRVRYKLFFDDETGYVEMARAYQQYLIDAGDLTLQPPQEKTPIYVEALGAIAKQKFFAGIPYASTVAASTLPEIQTIYQGLKAEGVEGLTLSVNGLFEGGMKHFSLSKLALDKNMGGMKAWKALQSQVEAGGDNLVPSLYLTSVYGTKRFNVAGQAARLHNGESASIVMMSEPRMQQTSMPYKSYYVSVHSLEDYVGDSLNALRQLIVKGAAVQDLGNLLVPDYARRKQISRIHALPTYHKALAAAAGEYKLGLVRPNAYAFKYASAVLGMPVSGNGFKIIKDAVPFLPLVLEGCVPGVIAPMNLRQYQPIKSQLMQAMEYRIAPAFALSFQKETIFHDTMDTDFMGIFSSHYQEQLPIIGEAYREYDHFYQLVKDARTISHEVLSSTLRRVRYDNGYTLLLNYANVPERLPEGVLNGLSYLLIRGE